MLSLQSAITVYLKGMAWKQTAYHINNSNPGHALKLAIREKFENNFHQSVQKHYGEGKREKYGQLQSVMH